MTTDGNAPDLSGLTPAVIAMTVVRGQAWRDALHRDLAQLGLDWLDAESLMEDYSVGGMDLELYWRAQRVIREHREMRDILLNSQGIDDGETAADLVHAAARRIADGEDLFVVRCALAVDLARRGMGPVLLPTMFDPDLWEAIDSRDPQRIEAYLNSCETLFVPTLKGADR